MSECQASVDKKVDAGLQAAIAALGGRGAQTKIASGLGLSRQAINGWDRIPADHVVAVERITGVPRETLRPDLYRTAKEQATAANV